jgi:salicylate hydroxylase
MRRMMEKAMGAMRRKVSDLPIVVVGAGIGGLTAALCLSRIGRRVAIIEQASQLSEIGAGIQLGPNVFKVFAYLNLTQAVLRNAVLPERYQIVDSITGENLTHMPLGEACVKRFGFPYGVIHRHDLHGALAEACKAEQRIEIRLNCLVDRYDAAEDGVCITASDGSVFHGAALVGADGLRSKIRATFKGSEPDPISPGFVAARAVLDIDSVPAEFRVNSVNVWFGPRNHIVFYPLRAGRLANLGAVFETDRQPGTDDWSMRAELQRAFEGQHPTVHKLLPFLGEKIYWAATERTATKNWSRGRVTLLGDAAHAMTQNLAQGGAMAIEDAAILADKIVLHGDDLEQAFVAYQNERYLRTGRVQLFARYYGHMIHATGVERELRNTYLKSRRPLDVHEDLAWLYEGISISPATADLLMAGEAQRRRA